MPKLSMTQVASGLVRPITITHAGDGSERLFILEQRGRIILVDAEGDKEPFLIIEDRVASPASGGGNEQGLLGLVFPPDYVSKEYFYVYYTMKNGDNVVSRFYLTSNPDLADPDSEQQLLTLPHPDQFTNHNGGQLAFGPDGNLYIGTGDGGGGGDPEGNAQDPSSLNGKLLRIDVESTPNFGDTYTIPADNPYITDAGFQDEIWALGLRNPWRFSFDRQMGDLYIADVGQGAWEEVNYQPASSPGGENYGWNIMEGQVCYPIGTPCNTTGLTLPVHTYERVGFPGDCSVTGGYVYRGTDYPELAGFYIFGDFCSGRIWGMQQIGSGWSYHLMANTSFRISSFGEDERGELYVADMTSGSIYRLGVNTNVFFFPLFRK